MQLYWIRGDECQRVYHYTTTGNKSMIVYYYTEFEYITALPAGVQLYPCTGCTLWPHLKSVNWHTGCTTWNNGPVHHSSKSGTLIQPRLITSCMPRGVDQVGCAQWLQQHSTLSNCSAIDVHSCFRLLKQARSTPTPRNLSRNLLKTESFEVAWPARPQFDALPNQVSRTLMLAHVDLAYLH